MDEALKAFGELMPKVASEEGTLMYSLNRDKANPNLLVVVEQYKDKAALEFHSSTAHFKSFFTAAGAFIGGLVFGYVTDADKAFDFSIWSLLIALGGAVVLLLILKLIFKKTLSGDEKFSIRKR